MTKDQKKICKALGDVRYLPASWDKRMGQNLAGIATAEPEKELSEKQNEWMYRLLYKYRKQLFEVYTQFKDHPFCTQAPKQDKPKHHEPTT